MIIVTLVISDKVFIGKAEYKINGISAKLKKTKIINNSEVALIFKVSTILIHSEEVKVESIFNGESLTVQATIAKVKVKKNKVKKEKTDNKKTMFLLGKMTKKAFNKFRFGRGYDG